MMTTDQHEVETWPDFDARGLIGRVPHTCRGNYRKKVRLTSDPASPTPAIERGLPKYPSDIPDPNLYCRDCDYWGPERRCPKCNDPMVEGPVEEEAIERGEEEPWFVVRNWSDGCEKCPDIYSGKQWIATVVGAPHLGHDSLERAELIVKAVNAYRNAPTPTPSAGQEDLLNDLKLMKEVDCDTIERLSQKVIDLESEVARLKDDSPGTPVAVLRGFHDLAYQLGHPQHSSRSPIRFIEEEITRLRGEVAKWNLVERAATEDNFSEFVPPDVHRVIDRIGAKMTKRLMREAVEHTQRIVDLTTRAETAEADLGRARGENERLRSSLASLRTMVREHVGEGNRLSARVKEIVTESALRPAAKDDEGGAK